MSLVMEVVACWLACVVLALNLVFFLVEKVRNKKVDLKPENNIIVITGCDSGFGEMTSRVLAKKGFHVISACLTDEGMKRLEDVVALTLKCDVTKENDITALAASISDYSTSTGCKVWGVVNNAGIVDGGNVDWTAMSVWRRVLEVNFFAVVAISKAMLPFLKRSPGSRIVNVSSLAGITGAPGMGPYFASKHAVEGMAKCAREELSHWDIHMSNINPGFMRTPLLASGSSAGKRSFESAPTEITSEYGTEWLEGQMETVNKLAENPKLVVDAIVDALTDSHPPMWYFPGNAAKVMRIAPMFSSGMWDFLRLFNGPSVARPTPEAIKKYR